MRPERSLRWDEAVGKRHLGALALVAPLILLLAAAPFQTRAGAQDACFRDYQGCPTLVGPDSLWLEPSGLVWVPEFQMLLGVTDDVGPARGYEIFYVRAQDLDRMEIPVFPLLTVAQSLALDVQDLEGLTLVDGTRTLYAVASLSLDKRPEGYDDRWNRHQMIRVDLASPREGVLVAERVARVSADRRPNIREWLISSSGRPWTPLAFQGRPEAGGINVEGLATDPAGNLLMGFRGPLEETRALTLRMRPGGPEDEPVSLGWLEMDVSGLPWKRGDPAMLERGIRGIDRIPGVRDEEYVVVVGHTGPRYDNLRIVRWNATTGEVSDLAELPESFVGEGIAVMEVTPQEIQVAVVSDRDARLMIRRFARQGIGGAGAEEPRRVP